MQPRPTDLEIATMEYQYAQSALEMAKKEYERISQGIPAELRVAREIRQLELELQKATSTYRQAKYNLRLISLGPFPLEVQKCQLQKKEALLGLDRLKRTMPDKMKQMESQVTQCEAQIETAKNQLDRAKSELAKAKVAAPGDGLVIYRQVWGDKVAVGITYWTGAPLIDIADIHVMELRGKVLEAQSGLLKAGQKAIVTVDGIPDCSFVGKVREMGKVAMDSNEAEAYGFANRENTGIKVFEIFISIEQSHALLFPQMSGQARVHIAEIKDALVVSKMALIEEHGKWFARVQKSDGTVEKREVIPGPDDADEITITKGVQEGETVLLHSK